MPNNFHTYEVKLFQKTDNDRSVELRDALADVFRTTDTNANNVTKQDVDWKNAHFGQANGVINSIERDGAGGFDTQHEADTVSEVLVPMYKQAWIDLGYPVLSATGLVTGNPTDGYTIAFDKTLDTSG